MGGGSLGVGGAHRGCAAGARIGGHRRDGRGDGVERPSALPGTDGQGAQPTHRVPLVAAPNPFYAMQSLAPFAALSSALRVAALELLRIGGDIRLLASGPATGLAELRLPAVQPGSSIMPGKVNPSMARDARHGLVPDRRSRRGHRGGHVRWPARAERDDAARGLGSPAPALDPGQRRSRLRREAGPGTGGGPERTGHYADRTVSLATALAPRIGYASAAEIVKESVRTGRSILDLAVERAGLRAPEAERILDVRRLTKPGRA